MPSRPRTYRPPGWRPPTQGQRTAAYHLRNQRVFMKFRQAFIAAHPVCADCKVEPSLDLHHVRGLDRYPDDLLDEAQCVALCHRCHSRRTARGEGHQGRG
jgi:5-methylcytosine-specific restriction endonuclease McrA